MARKTFWKNCCYMQRKHILLCKIKIQSYHLQLTRSVSQVFEDKILFKNKQFYKMTVFENLFVWAYYFFNAVSQKLCHHTGHKNTFNLVYKTIALVTLVLLKMIKCCLPFKLQCENKTLSGHLWQLSILFYFKNWLKQFKI